MSSSTPVIMMTTGQDEGMTIVRLEKSTQNQENESPACYVADGQFRGIVVKPAQDGGLVTVCKPHVRTWFYAHIRNSKESAEETCRERRELCFWFRRRTSKTDQVALATEYFKRLIEPEAFPRDYVGFIKKAMLLMQGYPLMRRVQLAVRLDPEPMDDMDRSSVRLESVEEEPPIENFITVLTPAVYDYQYLPEVPVSRKSHVAFRVLASADAHVALSHVYGDTDRRTYEIVLGGWNNTKSAIRYGGRGPVEVEADTPGLLNAEDFQSFWVSWKEDCVQVGRGMTKGVNCFLQWTKIPHNKRHTINLMSVSTGLDSDGRWEFIEYLAPVTIQNETKAVKRDKVRRAVIWYAKKAKMLENLEEAFPSSLNTKQILRLSAVRLSDMLEAVVFLKDLLKLGLAHEMSRGVWLRTPNNRLDVSHEVKIVAELPPLMVRDSPTVAILTCLYCEKLAVDTTLDNKISYVKEMKDVSGGIKQTSVYTLGRVGDHRVVSCKLGKIPATSGTSKGHSKAIDQLLETFGQLQHIILLGAGGGVPNYTDYEKHVKRGDVAISVAKTSDAPIYVHCSDAEQSSPDEQAFFSTSVWNAADDAIQKVVKQLADMSVSRTYDKRSWDKYLESGQEMLKKLDDRFHRPPGKTDKLFALLDGEEKPVLVRHPLPPPDKQYTYRENAPNIRCGPIGSGRAVARSDTLRMEFASCHGVVAYDRGLHHVVDAIMNSRISSFITVLGICDYVDGTKTRTWQPYAAMCAAAFTKSLLLSLPTYNRRRSYYL